MILYSAVFFLFGIMMAIGQDAPASVSQNSLTSPPENWTPAFAVLSGKARPLFAGAPTVGPQGVDVWIHEGAQDLPVIVDPSSAESIVQLGTTGSLPSLPIDLVQGTAGGEQHKPTKESIMADCQSAVDILAQALRQPILLKNHRDRDLGIGASFLAGVISGLVPAICPSYNATIGFGVLGAISAGVMLYLGSLNDNDRDFFAAATNAWETWDLLKANVDIGDANFSEAFKSGYAAFYYYIDIINSSHLSSLPSSQKIDLPPPDSLK
jgi:hypothetical protein